MLDLLNPTPDLVPIDLDKPYNCLQFTKEEVQKVARTREKHVSVRFNAAAVMRIAHIVLQPVVRGANSKSLSLLFQRSFVFYSRLSKCSSLHYELLTHNNTNMVTVKQFVFYI